ncbi:type II toxin-antitoxin system ParD family antitoxin [Sphingomonas sp. LT1P40]|uniref:type II toxin-antitoxin system ParD family antitoxin n=1 Tax=Alteristakelama amylovorans TaxID=3096166 RepID=UPI002FC5C4A1
MASSVELGTRLEEVVTDLVKRGRYNSRSEVLREGVRIIQEREAKLAELEASIRRGIEEIEAGGGHDLEDVTTRLVAKYTDMAKGQSTT